MRISWQGFDDNDTSFTITTQIRQRPSFDNNDMDLNDAGSTTIMLAQQCGFPKNDVDSTGLILFHIKDWGLTRFTEPCEDGEGWTVGRSADHGTANTAAALHGETVTLTSACPGFASYVPSCVKFLVSMIMIISTIHALYMSSSFEPFVLYNKMRYIIRGLTCIGEMLKDHLITVLDHLVKEEIILVGEHLTHHGKVSTYPSIHLLCSRQIKNPFPISICKFGPLGWVTMLPTKIVGLLVLWLEMEYVNWHDDAFKKLILLFGKMSLKLTIVIKKYDIGEIFWNWVYRFDKVLLSQNK